MTGRVAGFDLGTTNSEVAVWTERGVTVLEAEGSAVFPSVVGLGPDGRLLVGERARNQFALHPERTVRCVKRLMGTGETVTMGDRRYRPQEISAMILRALRDRAERAIGEPLQGAVITVPAYFSDAQRQATRDAGEIAGLAVLRVLNEPTAAALAYEHAADEGKTILVYDFGGGTFDVSVVRQESGVSEVLASHGDTRLGGEDLDRALLDRVLRRAVEEEPGTRDLRRVVLEDRRARARLLRSVEAARVRLSGSPCARLREDWLATSGGAPVHVDLEITREEFEACARPLLERTLVSVHRALGDAGLTSRDLDEVLLAGGATRTPLVSNLLEEATGLAPRSDLHPDLCVALGAGVMAARLEGEGAARVLVDVTPYSFGPSFLGRREDGDLYPHCYAPVIRRTTPLPASVTRRFVTVDHAQSSVEVVVYQGEDPDALRNIEIGRFRVEGLTAAPAGNEILCRMDLDVDGILEITATEKITGMAKTVRIEGAVGRLGPRELVDARERVAALFTREEAIGPASPVEPAPEALPREAWGLVARWEKVRAKLHPEDREEGDDLVRRIRERSAAGRGGGGSDDREPDHGRDAARALEDLLFYTGEGRG